MRTATHKAQRERWIEEKGMQVLNFFSDQHKATSVDVFVTEPFDFDSEYDNAPKSDLAPGLPVQFISISKVETTGFQPVSFSAAL